MVPHTGGGGHDTVYVNLNNTGWSIDHIIFTLFNLTFPATTAMLVKNKNIKLMAMILFSDIDAFSSFFIRNLFPPLKATIILYHLLADLSNLTFLLFSR